MKKKQLEEGAKSQIEKVLGQLRHFVTEMEKRNKIAQTQVLDLKIAQKTRNLRHIIIHAKTA